MREIYKYCFLKKNMQTLAKYILEAVKKYENKTFLIDRGAYRRKAHTYKEIYRKSEAICGFFEKNKIKKKDKIMIYLPNSSDYAALLWACAFSGVIAVPIDFNSNTEFANKIAELTQVKIIFCSVYKQPDKGKRYYQEELDKIYTQFKDIEILNKPQEQDIFEIVYTSGTTSDPKGVILTNKNLVVNVESMGNAITFKIENYNFLSILPLSHLFEQNAGFFLLMHRGSKIIYGSSKKSSALIETIKEEKITAAITVPLFLESIKNKIEFEARKQGKEKELENTIKKYANFPILLRKLIFYKVKKNLGNLKFFITGGAALAPEVEKFFRTIGINVLQGYGLTETSPVLTWNTLEENKLGSVGKPLKNIQVQISEDNEILAKGENTFLGYYQNPEETRKMLKNDWIHTGDLGKFDNEGFLFIIGRKKNIILSSSGLNIYPEDIEKVLNKIPEVKESVVLGLNNGKKLVGIILPKENMRISKEKLLKETNNNLSSNQYLSEIIIWQGEDFPRTTTKKIIRRKVQELIEKNSTSFSKEITTDKLINLIAEICEISPKKIKESSLLVELGLDSIKRIDLAVKIEELFNIEFDEDSINQKSTVSTLRKSLKSPEEIIKQSGLNLFNSKKLNIIRLIFQALANLITKAMFSLKIKGKENLNELKSQAIFIANHTSMLDTFAIYRALPLKYRLNTYPAGAQDFFFSNKKKFFGFMSRLIFNAFSFSREGHIKQSLKDFGTIINLEGNVLIYPEGTRSRTGKLLHFKRGIGILAQDMEVPIIPIKINGIYDVMPTGIIFPKYGKVELILGKPIKFSKMQSPQQIIDILEKEMKNLS